MAVSALSFVAGGAFAMFVAFKASAKHAAARQEAAQKLAETMRQTRPVAGNFGGSN
jgi:flagellar basal body-associated protein FliL